MNPILTEQLPTLFKAVAAQFDLNMDGLCRMDSTMGDGDLGLTMQKGFGALPDILQNITELGLSQALCRAGIEMTDIVPSTMGMLMGTGISYGGKSLVGKDVLDAEGLVLFLNGFCDGIVKRGKCKRGDRTVLDCIGQAADHAKNLLAAYPSASLEDICRAALDGAKKGVEATKHMLPKYGKAVVHTNIALGRPDQGAVAGLVFIQGLSDYILS